MAGMFASANQLGAAPGAPNPKLPPAGGAPEEGQPGAGNALLVASAVPNTGAAAGAEAVSAGERGVGVESCSCAAEDAIAGGIAANSGLVKAGADRAGKAVEKGADVAVAAAAVAKLNASGLDVVGCMSAVCVDMLLARLKAGMVAGPPLGCWLVALAGCMVKDGTAVNLLGEADARPAAEPASSQKIGMRRWQ